MQQKIIWYTSRNITASWYTVNNTMLYVKGKPNSMVTLYILKYALNAYSCMLYIVNIFDSTNDVASMFKIPSSYPKISQVWKITHVSLIFSISFI